MNMQAGNVNLSTFSSVSTKHLSPDPKQSPAGLHLLGGGDRRAVCRTPLSLPRRGAPRASGPRPVSTGRLPPRRVPQGTLCLITALARHGLTDVIPDRIDVAIPRGKRIPALQSPAEFHVFAKDTFAIGREVIRIGDGLTIGQYSAERSLVDVVRLRHREGADIAWEALRRWLRQKGARPATLLEMARSFHGAESAVRHALDVVL